MDAGGADGYTLEELLQAATAKPKKPWVSNVVCPHCKRKGHSTTQSAKCLYHKSKPQEPVPETEAPDSSSQVLQDRAKDIDDHAAFLLQDDDTPSDHEDEFAEFFDSGTWESDDEETEEQGMNNTVI
jgi:hypothetical protein